jgi:hypothetical protein
MLYMLTSRFASVYDLVLKLIQVFIEKVGSELEGTQCAEFLMIVTQLTVPRYYYN